MIKNILLAAATAALVLIPTSWVASFTVRPVADQGPEACVELALAAYFAAQQQDTCDWYRVNSGLFLPVFVEDACSGSAAAGRGPISYLSGLSYRARSYRVLPMGECLGDSCIVEVGLRLRTGTRIVRFHVIYDFAFRNPSGWVILSLRHGRHAKFKFGARAFPPDAAELAVAPEPAHQSFVVSSSAVARAR